MVKKISPTFATQVETLKASLGANHSDFQDAVQAFNEAMDLEWEALEEAYAVYQESLVETANEACGISQEITDEVESQDEDFQTSDEGETLSNWAADWELVSEDLQMAAETPLEDVVDRPEMVNAEDMLDPVEILESAPLHPDEA